METLFILGICGLLLCLLLSFFALMAYSGLFHNIQVSTGKPPIGDMLVAYKFSRGPYKDAGQIFSEVVGLAPYKKTIGVYYDDPKQVPADKTRYIVGAILAEESESADEEILCKMKAEGYNVTRFPEISHAVKTTFPFKCTFSIFIAFIRVYPQLGSYLKERRLCAHPILEVYDDRNIHFIAPLAKQNDFYVEEAKSSATEEQGSDEEDSTNETVSNYSCSASEQSGRSFSTFSTEASDLSTTTTATGTACFNSSSLSGFTDSSKSVSREKSLTPAMENPIKEEQQEMVEAISVASPLLVKAESSPVSVDDDQEWENLGDFRPQDDEELEASIPPAQEIATTPATPDSADLVLLGNLQDGQLQDEDVSPSKEMAPLLKQEDKSLLQNSVASNLEESGFSESVMSTLQDSGLGTEESSAPDPQLAAAARSNTPVDVVAPATLPLQLPLQPTSPPQQQQQQQPQSPQLVEIESDTASEHSTGSSSYEEVKLAEVTDA